MTILDSAHQARLPRTPIDPGARLRLIHARLIDGYGGPPIEDAEVVIVADRIEYAGSRREDLGSDRDPAAGAAVVDLRGRTILPGFIDTHVHLATELEADPAKVLSAFPAEKVLDAAVNIRRTLLAGVTTARDLGGLEAGYRGAIADGTILGPRLHLALSALSPTGGHSDAHLPNGRSTRALSTVDPIVDTDDEVRRTTRLLIRSGADVIKVCASGGVTSPSDHPSDVGVPAEQIRIILAETGKRQGQPVAAHAQGIDGILEAVRGGAASIEHGYQLTARAAEMMIEHGTTLVPTLTTALRLPERGAVPDHVYQTKLRWSEIAREHIAAALEAGVSVALGTDAGMCPHGINLTELGRLVELGMAPMEALVAGTRHAAELLRLDDQLGTVENGKLADLVITDRDPVTEITSLAAPAAIGAVLQGGRLVKDLGGWFPADPVQPAIAG